MIALSGSWAWLVDVGKIAGAAAAILGLYTLLAKTRPMRAIGKRLFADPAEEMLTRFVDDHLEPLKATIDDTHHLVEWHLGPNTDTPKVRDMVIELGDSMRAHEASDDARFADFSARLDNVTRP